MPNERSAQPDNSLLRRDTENETEFVPHDVLVVDVVECRNTTQAESAPTINN